MYRRWMTAALCVIVLTCVVSVGGAAGQPTELTELPFFLTFVPNIQFSQLYVAIEKGYFAEEGLNVIIQHGNEPDGASLIAAGQLDFGIISGEQVILARARGLPLVYVYAWFQEYPVGIVVPDNLGVSSVRDLIGRKVGIPGRFGASYTGLLALLAANDMTESDIQLEPIGFNAPDVVCQGGVEASVIYVNNEPLQIQQRAEAGTCGDITSVTVFRVADAANMVSNGITTSEMAIAERPELVRAVVRAHDRGLRDVINNPAEAYLLSRKYVETLPASEEFVQALEEAASAQAEFLASNPDREAIAASREALRAELQARFEPKDVLQFLVLLETIKLWDAERLGGMELSAWEITQETLLTMPADIVAMPGPIDLSAVFTEAFLPPVEQ
ncbi:MAG: ABC transporter substrate-binding protein [Aggregatilineales bacterium]